MANGIGMNSDGVRAVFKVVTLLVRFEWKLALFAHRHKTALQFQGDRGGKNESARIDSDHRIDIAGFESSAELLNTFGKKRSTCEYGRDVFELNSGLGKIRNVANGLFQIMERRAGCVVHCWQNYGNRE